MFRTLVESRPVRARSRSAAAFSLVVHVTLVGSAIAATASRVADPVEAAVIKDIIFIPQRPAPVPDAPKPRPTEPAPQTPSNPSQSTVEPIEAPTEVPDGIKPADPNAPTTVEPTFGPGDPFESIQPGAGTGDPFAGIMWADEVEVAVSAIGRQRQPRYPEVLRASHVEGGVSVMFIVDSTGKVEPESFKVIESSHALFEPAVKAAVLAQRFRPAKWRGQQVRQLVQQRFVFTLSR